ncbi:hypothetical protein Ddye_001990 [Dipteronia dyeriana]|uniref:COBRA C-terminal domain-containing protein n=1 Tax=Dipteronia dyeriana TaxID=168575 RepID=A0AAE0CU15_9ROSI|nr:hypothetical protein Ddye_001990 [Dipteronia dyeriana]
MSLSPCVSIGAYFIEFEREKRNVIVHRLKHYSLKCTHLPRHEFSGSGDHKQQSNVSANHEPRLDLRMDMGKERSDLVNGGSTSHRPRRLFQVQGNIPHCCSRNPTMVDLPLGVPKNQQFSQCCKDGELASWGEDPAASVSSFQLSVGVSGTSNKTVRLPKSFYLLGPGPGYTCSAATIVQPSTFFSSGGRKKTYAMMSWTVTCSYSQTLASKYPKCCVSLSSFYNPNITPCPSCACGCQNENNCIMNDPKSFSTAKSDTPVPQLQCTNHMCPIRVHWHVKTNYKEHWRVKITITNFNYQMKNTQCTLVVRHPNLKNVTDVFRFVYKPLTLYESISSYNTNAVP